jgi:sortase A
MRTVLGAVGRVLVTLGTLLLLFVAYQLWGTGIYQARAQDDLKHQFQDTLERSGTSPTRPGLPPTTTPGLPTTSTTLPSVTVPDHGKVLARIVIPKIGVDQYVVEGVDVEDLRLGPGHYPGTQLPGHEGNTAIAGHRTTYGAPFGNLDQLQAGDQVVLTTVQGVFKYVVTEQRVVNPNDVSVLDPTPDPARTGHDLATITLTTCNPKYSAAERLVVQARLDIPKGSAPLPAVLLPPGSRPTSINGLSGEQSSRSPTILWGAIVLLIGLLWWLWFHRHPRWTTWILGAIPFLVALFVCYTYLERLLPSNY